ncbi:hypothetical protein XENTR_v10004256 [Xenopus tropicalis]|nr:hypothetical protein XENTR_v10004256 [Xenopus tropicalis]
MELPLCVLLGLCLKVIKAQAEQGYLSVQGLTLPAVDSYEFEHKICSKQKLFPAPCEHSSKHESPAADPSETCWKLCTGANKPPTPHYG